MFLLTALWKLRHCEQDGYSFWSAVSSHPTLPKEQQRSFVSKVQVYEILLLYLSWFHSPLSKTEYRTLLPIHSRQMQCNQKPCRTIIIIIAVMTDRLVGIFQSPEFPRKVSFPKYMCVCVCT